MVEEGFGLVEGAAQDIFDEVEIRVVAGGVDFGEVFGGVFEESGNALR